ncbi:hypothetical protein SAMN06265222_10155 [Neorhodopirellula lusitana]|uniref:Uncharacterized protein n=1 Tax=Neorhodopirellula lusitana TaxID=445327 RepID=A0ABY1PN48_9BACT|nr:hypothetical protein [Neorhodopirellula lusitana]SMP37953.1 hypothetical protein SAMN06265222_10155 [Neorhodopirellula lusitana]
MSGPSIQELLGLPADVTQPNAYQLFGLQIGESDLATIEAAITRRIAALKQAKPQAAPDKWKRAALAVQTAQRTLSDPDKKAELDASFGIMNEPVPTAAPAELDPLAMLLPTSNPAQPIQSNQPRQLNQLGQPNEAPTSGSSVEEDRPAAWQSAEAPPEQVLSDAGLDRSLGNAVAAGAPAAIQVSPRRPVRRKKNWAGFVLSLMALLLLAGVVGGLGYFVLLDKNSVQIVKTQDGFHIKTGNRAGSGEPQAGQTQEIGPDSSSSNSKTGDAIYKTPRSPVSGQGLSMEEMGAPLGPSSSSGPIGAGSMDLGSVSSGPMASDSMSPDSMGPDSASSPPADPGAAMSGMGPPSVEAASSNESPAASQSPVASQVTAASEGPAVSGEMQAGAMTSSKPPTDAEIAAGQLAIGVARDAVRTAKWDQMVSLAEQAESKAVTDKQELDAMTLYQYADLATFYRGAITRALAGLKVNSEIKITSTRNVLVNEVDANHLKVMLGKNNYKEYTLDELPFVIAHELASYQLKTDTPAEQSQATAAKAAFQAIAAQATPGHRQQSIEMFRGLASLDGADPQRLANFLESLDR